MKKEFAMTPHLGDGDWLSIAEQASKEMDPAKLTILVEKLCCALEGERRGKSQSAATSQGVNEPSSFPSG
jgi:hypothetical protein